MQLEKQLKEKAQVEEEVKMYRDQCNALMEQLSAVGSAPPQQPMASPGPSPSPRARSQRDVGAPSPSASSVFDRMRQAAAKGVAQLNERIDGGA